ncbi:MAG: hypothetical protein ACYDDF_13465 [Thermoplasmatota archaeon]
MFEMIPRKLRYALFALAVFAITAPQGIRATTVLEAGHTVWSDEGSNDPCLAAVAGLVQGHVLWFNDNVLATTSAEGQYIYAVPANATAPFVNSAATTTYPILGDGVQFSFADPNDPGFTWNVMEGKYNANPASQGGSESVNGGSTSVAGTQVPTESVSGSGYVAQTWNYIWFVQISADRINSQIGDHVGDHYDFIDMIDTCKLPKSTYAGNASGSPSFNVDLYVGGNPTFVPAQGGCAMTPPPAAGAGACGSTGSAANMTGANASANSVTVGRTTTGT